MLLAYEAARPTVSCVVLLKVMSAIRAAPVEASARATTGYWLPSECVTVYEVLPEERVVL